MSQPNPLLSRPDVAPRWRLWIDGCGGYLLLGGEAWTVGGFSDGKPADICVRADWPRRAGEITRQVDDYLWVGAQSSEPTLVNDGQTIPVTGSADMKLRKPSPLCATAMLSVSQPHRFTDHVDGVLLVADAILLGPDADCHIRSGGLTDRVVMTLRDKEWLARVGLTGEFTQLSLGKRLTFPTMTMTLESA